MSIENSNESLERVAPSRRTLLKGVAAAGAFAVPFIASFSMDAPAMASPSRPHGPNMTACSNMQSDMFCSNQNNQNDPNWFTSNMTVMASNMHHHRPEEHHHREFFPFFPFFSPEHRRRRRHHEPPPPPRRRRRRRRHHH